MDAAYAGFWVWAAWNLARHLWRFHFLAQAGLPGWRFLLLLNEHRLLNFGWLTLVLAYLFFGAKFLAQRRFAAQPALFGMTTRILRPDALYTMTGGKKSFLPWDRFEALAEDRHSLYLCLPKNQAMILPKTAFGDRAAASEFLRLAREHRKQALASTAPGADKRSWPGQVGEAVWPPAPTDGPAQAATGRIRIIAAVPGEAPEEVRRAWTGLVLPALPGSEGLLHRGPTTGVLSGQPGGVGEGYLVPTGEALEVLARSQPEAAQWWRDKCSQYPTGHRLLFPAAVCEAMTD